MAFPTIHSVDFQSLDLAIAAAEKKTSDQMQNLCRVLDSPDSTWPEVSEVVHTFVEAFWLREYFKSI